MIDHAITDKGTAYTCEERVALRIEGLLPPRVESLEDQAARVIENVRRASSPLDKYRYLSAVRDENATVFYRVIVDHMAETLPLVYTPTVGQVCLEWSRIYDRPRGLYVSARQHRGRIAQLLRNWPRTDVALIVVTDGGRILGLGDLGANGMGIPIGKLALYTACAGLPPEQGLPITLDVGTDCKTVRTEPWYLGERHPRLTGPSYHEFLDEFINATQAVFPDAVVQFEDFNNQSAFALLDRYRDRMCCFNDDIQGTGAMGLAGLYAAGRITGRPLVDQRILFVGAGEACLGIGALVNRAMQREGLSDAQARARCLFTDSQGIVSTQRQDLPPQKQQVAQDFSPTLDLVATIGAFKPTALIGACARTGRFTEFVLRAMSRVNDRPVIFALSNPTSKAECTAEQAYAWTDGRAIFASGSPFPPVTLRGTQHTPAQANNCHIFPGVGLALVASGAQRARDELFLAAAVALSQQVSARDLERGCVYPPAAQMRDVALAVALAVATTAYDHGLASRARPVDLRAELARLMYVPEYHDIAAIAGSAALTTGCRAYSFECRHHHVVGDL